MDWDRYKQKATDLGLDIGISAANKAKRMKGISEDDRQEWENVEKNLRRKRELRERGVLSYDDEWNNNEYEDDSKDEWERNECYDDIDYDDSEDDEWDDIEERFDLPGSKRYEEQKVVEAVTPNADIRRFMKRKSHCNIGIIGHMGHGKTTLSAAITKVLHERYGTCEFVTYEKMDKVLEEREGVISIAAAHIEYETSNRCYTHTDWVRHSDFIKSMIAGAVQMDAAILVVNALDGVMAQTREQVLLLCQLGVSNIVVFMNKCDMVDEPELLELIDMEIRDLLKEYKFPGDEIPIVQGSAVKALEDPFSHWGDMIFELMEEIDCYIPDPNCDKDKPFLMPIEDVFPIRDRGIIATGRIERGMLHLSDEVEIVGISEEIRKTVVTGIEMFRKLLDDACAGDNVGILLRGIQTFEIERGQCLCKPGTVKCCSRLVAQVYILDESESGRRIAVFNQHHFQFYFRTAVVDGICYLPKGTEMCMQGDNIEMFIELTYPMPVEQGLRFALRENGKAVGIGCVVSIYPGYKS